ncbi:MAG: hypothetical protein QNJ51_14575 [Calothrix sp. MO_167.B12]|nr:hypothetical protein [Calothrix sp. MO_167.B12]
MSQNTSSHHLIIPEDDIAEEEAPTVSLILANFNWANTKKFEFKS